MNAYDNTIKIKPVDVKSSTYIDFNVENNDKDRKFKNSDHVRISIYIYIYIYICFFFCKIEPELVSKSFCN